MLTIEQNLSSKTLDELTHLYILSLDSDNNFCDELLTIVRPEHFYLYGDANLSFLDTAQLSDLNNRIGQMILHKTCENFTSSKQAKGNHQENIADKELLYAFMKEHKDSIQTDIKELIVIHENCYSANISTDDIHFIVNNSKVLAICHNNNPKHESCGQIRWDSVTALDKDETTSVYYIDKDNKPHTVYVPFDNISTSGSYCVNARSSSITDGKLTLLVWNK